MTASNPHLVSEPDGEPLLIASQLALPRPGATVVRTRLLERLDGAPPGAVVLLTGEPAAGKTTLVVDWLRTPGLSRPPHAFFRVPAGLADDELFWRYVLAAVETVGLEVDDLRAAIADEAPPGEHWTTVLANRLGNLGDQVVLVLDDLHELQSAASVEALHRLLDRLPPTVTVIILSRAVPPWSLSEWRMSGRLVEIRSEDLRFRPDEVAEFVRATVDVSLDQSDVSLLTERTEGWAGGVKLASLSLRRDADPSDFIARFAADDELVSTYLFRDVLERQDPDVRHFLLDVSILDELTADICDAVRGRHDGSEFLERCRSLNLFLTKLDTGGDTYQLHSMFADLLRARLSYDDPDRMRALHSAASRVFEDRRDLRASLRHATEAGEDDRVSALMERYTGELAHTGFFDEIQALVPALRRIARDRHPAAVMGLASALSVTGSVETTLRLLEELLDGDLSERDRLAAQQLLGFARMAHGDVHLLVETADALAALPSPGSTRPPPFDEVRFACYLRGVGSYFAGDLAAADEVLDRAVRRRQRPGIFHVESPGWQALVAAERGRLGTAERLADESERRQREMGSGETAVAVPGCLARARAAWERDEIDASREHLARARRWLRPLYWESVLVGVAESRLPTSGGPEAALTTLEEVANVYLGSTAAPPLQAMIAERAVDLNLRLGRARAAQHWAAVHERTMGPLPPALDLRLAEANAEPDLLAMAASAVERPQPDPLHIDVLLAAARVAWETGVMELGRRWVIRAATIAEPEGLIRRFCDAGPLIREVLVDLIDRPPHDAEAPVESTPVAPTWFMSRLAKECSDRRSPVRPPAPAVEGLVEPLSARELEVLGMLDRGLSYSDIGSELFVSRNTVKSHVRHVYTKLAVTSRTDAVDRGRRLGLL